MQGALFDTSIWIALAFGNHPHHAAARAVFEEADAINPAVFCRATQQSFLRQLSSPRLQAIYGAITITNAAASQKWEELAAMAQVKFAEEPEGLDSLWRQLAMRNTASPKVWMDAYLAAFAICSGLRLVTLDGDFSTYVAHGLQLRLLVG